MSPHPLVEDPPAALSEITVDDVLAHEVLGIAARHLPPYLVVDTRHRIVQFSGGSIATYLDPTSGAASLDLFELLNRSLHRAVREVMEEATRTSHPAIRYDIMREASGRTRRLRILAEILPQRAAEGLGASSRATLLMVMFDRQGSASGEGDGFGETLTNVLDDHQTLLQELRAANGKLQAARDEMQTAHAEMQSINAELSSKNHALANLNNDFKTLLDSTQIATLFLDADLRVRNFTPNVAGLFALRRGDIGRPVTDLRASVDYPELAGDVADVLRADTVVEREIGSLNDGHRVYIMRMHPFCRAEDSVNGVVLTFIDITARKRAEERALFLAHHDELTGLANRVVFNAVLDRSAEPAEGGRQSIGLLYLDLDRFKAVNDAYGHRVGDELLRKVAIRLRRCVRSHDVVCRLGGDEFAIIQRIRDQADATALAARIIASVGAPYDVDGLTIRIGVSVGIALRRGGEIDAEVLARSADVALYAAKARGRGHYQVFDPLMQHRVEERRDLEIDLGEALARDEFTILLQPLVQLEDRRITGAEALIRWQHPRHGLLLPAAFVPLAEETGQIVPIGSWVLRAACEQAAAWPEPLQLSVNLSSVQFASPDLLETVHDALTQTGLPAHRLTLELTETVLLKDEWQAQDRLGALRRLGVKIALDDFGTGYSSLSYLHSFAVDKIKIDRAFTQTLESRKESGLIVKAVVQIAKGLEVTVCAEGAETDGQLDELTRLGVHEVQGFGLYLPMTAPEFATHFPGPAHA